MARTLGRGGQQDRKGLLRRDGFRGVLGSYRFLPSGLALRGLSVTDGRIGTLATTGA